jgi:hypothetical protein
MSECHARERLVWSLLLLLLLLPNMAGNSGNDTLISGCHAILLRLLAACQQRALPKIIEHTLSCCQCGDCAAVE